MYVLGQSDTRYPAVYGYSRATQTSFLDYRIDVEALFQFACLVVAWDGHSERIDYFKRTSVTHTTTLSKMVGTLFACTATVLSNSNPSTDGFAQIFFANDYGQFGGMTQLNTRRIVPSEISHIKRTFSAPEMFFLCFL